MRSNNQNTEVLVTITGTGSVAPFDPQRLLGTLKGWLKNQSFSTDDMHVIGFRACASINYRVPSIQQPTGQIVVAEEFGRDVITVSYESVTNDRYHWVDFCSYIITTESQFVARQKNSLYEKMYAEIISYDRTPQDKHLRLCCPCPTVYPGCSGAENFLKSQVCELY